MVDGQTGDPRETGTPQGVSDPQAPETFYDASKVPEALRPTFVEMQGNYTRKTQALSERERALSAKEQSLDQASYKASLYDTLVANPVVRKFFQKYDEVIEAGGDPESLLGEARAIQQSDYADPAVQELIDRKFTPLQKDIERMQEQQRLQAQAAAFAARHPEWEKYREPLLELLNERERKGQRIDYEDAYRIVRDIEREKKESQANLNRRADAATVETPSSQVTAVSKGTPVSGDKAFNQALKKAAQELGWGDDLTPPG